MGSVTIRLLLIFELDFRIRTIFIRKIMLIALEHEMKKAKTSKYANLPFAILFWVVGFLFFWSWNSTEIELRNRLDAIHRGDATELLLTVDQKWVQPGSGSGSDRGQDSHWISFEPIEETVEDIDRSPAYEEWRDIQVGQQFKAHWVHDDVVVEKMDRLHPKAKWVILGFCMTLGMVPLSMTGYQILRSDD